MKKINDLKVQRFLDELGDEYKNFLLEKLIEQTDSLDNLSVSKLISIDNDVKRYINRKQSGRKYWTFQLVGVLYVCIGIFAFLFTEIMMSFHDLNHLSLYELIQMGSIIMALVGVFAFVFPFLFGNMSLSSKYTKNHKERIKFQEYEVVSMWRELEGICNDLSLKEKVVTNKSIIQLLVQEDLINKEEEKELISFLKLRNCIVHGSGADITDDEIAVRINKVESIISAICRRLYPKKKGNFETGIF